MAKWVDLPLEPQHIKDVDKFLKTAAKSIITENNSFWRPEQEKDVFRFLEVAFMRGGWRETRRTFTTLAHVGKCGDVEILELLEG
jgi:hypothetical protein